MFVYSGERIGQDVSYRGPNPPQILEEAGSVMKSRVRVGGRVQRCLAENIGLGENGGAGTETVHGLEQGSSEK